MSILFNKHTRLFSSIANYKSAISLDKLYPNSSQKLTTPLAPKSQEKFNGYIPIEELNITYSRSSGPGGQNVNKVNTKVEVRVDITKSSWIHNDIKSKLIEKYRSRITNQGELVIRSDLTRYQHMNLADCLEKLRNIVRTADFESKEKVVSAETAEKLRRQHEKMTRERLASKRERSQVKSDRQSPIIVD